MRPKDRVAFVIAVGLITWGALAIGGSIYRSKSFTEGGAEFFVAIGGAMVASLVAYFTSKNGDK